MICGTHNCCIVLERSNIIVRSKDMHNFMKKKKQNSVELTTEELINSFSKRRTLSGAKLVGCGLALCILCLIVFSVTSVNHLKALTLDNEEEFSLATAPMAATSSKRDVITIPSGVVKANPFVPYRKLGNEIKEETLVNDVPRFDLIAPPDLTEAGEQVAKIMDTVVSGILFDKFSPSAILKIDGVDYLVKKGDVVHNYKVLNIAQNSVTVQLGKNTYKAGIGEILTDGSVNYNDISNLNKKFGGELR